MPMLDAGDLVIRGTAVNGFELIDALTSRHMAGPFERFTTAMAAARARQPHAIWQQSVDHRGRLLGELFQLRLSRSIDVL